MTTKNLLSRRQVIGGIGAGLATLIVSPVRAGEGPRIDGAPINEHYR